MRPGRIQQAVPELKAARTAVTMADGAALPAITGTVTARGLRIPIDALTARLGGRRGYLKFLATLTVVEKPQPGRPKAYARAQRSAHRADPDAPGHVLVPRVKAPALLGRVLGAVRHDPAAAEARRLGGGVREIPARAWAPAQAFYDYQMAAADHLCDPGGPLAPVGGTGGAYIQMGTGLGKTRLAMAVAARGRGPVFVVVPTDGIRVQWVDEFRAVYPDLKVAAYDNPPKKSRRVAPTAATHDVVVGIVNTVRKKPGGFFAGYATVILDEAHEYSSPKNIEVLWLAQEAPRVLGLSATPDDRPTGLDRVVYHFLGPPIRAETDIPGFDIRAVHFRGRVREVEYAGDPDYCETAVSAAGTVSAIGTVGNLVADPARLRLVAAEVERLYNLHATASPAELAEFGLGPRPAAAATPKHPEGGVRTHGVFVFAEHREYLPALRAALLGQLPPGAVEVPELGDDTPADGADDAPTDDADAAPADNAAPAIIDGDGPVVLRGGATREQIDQSHQARVVLTTYGYSRRGVSIIDMTAIVLASPRRHGMMQILGRVTRRGSDESILRIVVDIKDTRSALKGQSSDRRAVYKAKGYPIYRVRADHLMFAAHAPAPAGEQLVWEPLALEDDADGADGAAAENGDQIAAADIDELFAELG